MFIGLSLRLDRGLPMAKNIQVAQQILAEFLWKFEDINMFKHKISVRIFDRTLVKISEDMIKNVQWFSQKAGKIYKYGEYKLK